MRYRDLMEYILPEPTINQELATMGDDPMCEMTIVKKANTGIDGRIFISSKMGNHGPRVKFFIKTGGDQPSFSVSISDNPEIKACSKGFEKYAKKYGPQVIEFVRLNKDVLLEFWDSDISWDNDVVQNMINSFQHVS